MDSAALHTLTTGDVPVDLRSLDGEGPDLRVFDWILVNSSAGKDSQAMLDIVVERARAAGVLDRVVVVHCDLGRVEWKGTRELAERQAAAYGVRFEVIRRNGGDLLDHVAERGKWPAKYQRFCTSDHKRAQVRRVMTLLVDEFRLRLQRCGGGLPIRRCRILNCMGLRADESPDRANCTRCKRRNDRPKRAGKGWVPMARCTLCGGTGDRAVLAACGEASNGRREVIDWLPIHDWTTAQVWDRIRASGVPHHRAYDLGMRRLSCVFCIFAPPSALLLAGEHNRDLLDAYVEVEARIGHSFKSKLPIVTIRDRLDAGERADVATDDGCWGM